MDESVHVIRLHPLAYLDEGGEVVVGRKDTDSYGLFPADGAELVRRLAEGMAVSDAAAWYEGRYGEPVDIDEFVDTLRELDLVVADDTIPIDGPYRVRWQRLGQALFSPAAWIVYGMLVAATVAICVAQPRFAPVRGNVFFSNYLVLVEISLSLAQIPMMLAHEAFHVLAGRRLGLNATLSVGRRLWFLGFETSLDGLVVLPRRKRYLPILAGMIADVLVLCALTVVAWATERPDGTLTLAGGFCLALAFTALPRIGWQFYFFLRTDVYQLVVTVLSCVDLHTTAKQIVANRFWTVLGRRDRLVDASGWHPRDVQVARWYAPLFVTGYLVMIGFAVLVTVPLAWRFFATATRTLLDGSQPTSRFWDAALLLTITFLQFGLSAVLGVRGRLRRRAGASS